MVLVIFTELPKMKNIMFSSKYENEPKHYKLHTHTHPHT